MKPALAAVSLLVAVACTQVHPVQLTFGTRGEGLDGFVCKASDGGYLLDRLAVADGGALQASLVTDFIQLGGLPGCRSSQLITWCGDHSCTPLAPTRVCTPISLPTRVSTGAPDGGALARLAVRDLVSKSLKVLKGQLVSADAPDDFVILRVLATAQPCSEVMVPASGVLPEYDRYRLIGCAYSCPTLFDQVGQEVFLSFDTFENECEHGVRTCADNSLKWAP